MAIHIVDRRLNPGSKSLENRQRFLRRAKALVQGAVKKSSQDRDIKDVLEGGEVSVPIDGMDEPRFRREGGTRDMVLPGNKKFIEGDMLPRPNQGGGKGRGAGEGDSEDAFRFVLSRDEFVDLFLDDLELPDLAKRKLAEVESQGIRRAGYTTSGSPANISITRTVSRALARRVALRRPRPEVLAALEAELADCSDEARRAELMAEIEALKIEDAPHPVHRSDRHPLPAVRDGAEAGGAGRDVLPDGRLRFDDRAHEGSRQAVLHAALRVPEAALSARRDRFHPAYRPGRRGRRADVLPWAGVRRHAGVERVAGDARHRADAVSSGGLEHLCRAGFRRRQFLFRWRGHQPAADRDDPAGHPVLRLSGSRPGKRL